MYWKNEKKDCHLQHSYLFLHTRMQRKQGWEFTHWFPERIARFLRKNEQMSDLFKKTSDLLKKQAIRPFAHFLWATWAIRHLPMVAHFWWATWANHLHRSLKKREWANRSGFFKRTKKYDKNRILVKFSEQIAHSLICHERPEQIAQGCSFVMSDLSDSLTVPVLTWSTWVNRSQSLICPERSERIAHSRSFDSSDLSKWANARWENSQPLTKATVQYIVT